MNARRAYEAEVIGTFARMANLTPSLSDAERDQDRVLFQAVQDAKLCFLATIRNYNAGVSVGRQIDIERVESALSDELPDEEAFEERLSEARRYG